MNYSGVIPSCSERFLAASTALATAALIFRHRSYRTPDAWSEVGSDGWYTLVDSQQGVMRWRSAPCCRFRPPSQPACSKRSAPTPTRPLAPAGLGSDAHPARSYAEGERLDSGLQSKIAPPMAVNQPDKEAFIKAVGVGLSYPLQSFDVTLTPGEPARILRAPGQASTWSIRDLSCLPAFAAAIVVTAPGARLPLAAGSIR